MHRDHRRIDSSASRSDGSGRGACVLPANRALPFHRMAELVRTEHDHLELSGSVAALRGVVEAVENGRWSADDAYESFANQVEQLVERLIVHFDREEQGLFPFLARELPENVPTLGRLESAHDAVCGALLRIAGIVRTSPEGFAD